MSYESYRTVHDVPGIVLSNPAPASQGDPTSVPPVDGEMRCDGTAIYVASVAPDGTVTWSSVALTAM